MIIGGDAAFFIGCDYIIGKLVQVDHKTVDLTFKRTRISGAIFFTEHGRITAGDQGSM